MEVEGLTIDHANGRWLSLPRAIFELELADLMRGRVHFYLARFERPRFDLRFLANGDDNMVEPRKGSGNARMELFVDRFELDHGEIILDQERIPLSIESKRARVRLRGRGDFDLDGQILAEEITLRLPHARPIAVAAAAHVNLKRGSLDLISAEVASPGLRAELSGGCQWGRAVNESRCTIQARGTTSGTTLAELGYVADLDGELLLDGVVSWRPGTFGWRSRVQAEELTLWQRQIAHLDGIVVADRFGARLHLSTASYGGGRVEGEISYEPTGTTEVELEFENVDLDSLLSDQGVHIVETGSSIDGELVYRFELANPRRGTGQSEIEIKSSNGGLHSNGRVPIRMREGIIINNGATLAAANQSLLASGWYDLVRRRGQFEYEVATVDLGELADIFVFDEEPTWRPRSGRGSLTGTLFVREDTVATNLRVHLAAASTDSMTSNPVNGTLRLTAQGIDDLDLTIGTAGHTARVTGYSGKDTELRLDTSGWPIATLAPWLPIELPIDGELTGTIDIVQSAANSISTGNLQGHIDSISGRWEQRDRSKWHQTRLAIEGAEISARWSPTGIEIQRLLLTDSAGSVEGRGFLGADGTVSFQLETSPLDLGADLVASLLPGIDLGGHLSVKIDVDGTRQNPHVSVSAGASSLTIAGTELADDPTASMNLQWRGQQLSLEGHVLGLANLSGGGFFDGDSFDLQLALDGGALLQTPLARLLGWSEDAAPISERFSGTLVAQGSASRSRPNLRANLELGLFELEIADVGLIASGPIEAIFDGRQLTISAFDLIARDELRSDHFAISGVVDVTRDGHLELELEATTSVETVSKLLVPESPDLQTRGFLDGRVTVSGTLERPSIHGNIDLTNATVDFGSLFPHPITELEGHFQLEPGGISINRLHGDFAGGSLDARGHYPFDATRPYELAVELESITINYPQGWSLAGDGGLQVRSNVENSGQLISGDFELSSVEYLLDIDLGLDALITTFLARQRQQLELPEGPLADSTLAIRLKADNAIRIRNNVADITGSADLDLRGSLARPLLFGTARVDPAGSLSYSGIDYALLRGNLHFSSPTAIDPEIDLVAVTRRRNFDINIAFTGTLDHLTSRFSSNPPLPELEVFALLSGDTIREQAWRPRSQTIGTSASASASAASFLYGQAAGVIGERVNTLFGLDSVRIDPLTGSGDGVSSARVTVGKRLTKDLFLTYSTDPTSTETERFQLEWQLDHGFRLVLTQNGDNSYSADLRRESSF